MSLSRRYFEPGPTVLLSSRWQNQTHVMTVSQQIVVAFAPSLIGCVIPDNNRGFTLIRNSGECVINLPTKSMIDAVVAIANTTNQDISMLAELGLTVQAADQVGAPLIVECHANFECRLYNTVLVDDLNFFVFEVVKAHVAPSPTYPETLHYIGSGMFMVSGDIVDRSARFKPEML